MFDFFTQRSTQPFRGRLLKNPRYLREDITYAEPQGDLYAWGDGIQLTYLLRRGNSIIAQIPQYTKYSIPKEYDPNKTYYRLVPVHIKCNLPEDATTGTLYDYGERRKDGFGKFTTPDGTEIANPDKVTTTADYTYQSYEEVDIKLKTYRKGEENPFFKADYEEFVFNITDTITQDKRQPVANMVLKGAQMSITTNSQSEYFVQGGYIEFNGELWIIRSVSIEKGPQKSVFSFWNVNPISSTKMTVEKVYEAK